MSNPLTVAVIGGGAAGFFGAIACAETNKNYRVILLEKTRQVLSKVRVSGGGRCNVTHSCFDPALLVQNYPRGHKALRGPFSRFQPRDTVQWFESRGVPLKTEADGRMFPITNSSETIVQCLVTQAKAAGVAIWTECGVVGFSRLEKGFILSLANGKELQCDRLLIATGSNAKAYEWLKALGHTVVEPVPSLFTFNVPTSPLLELSGVSVPKARLKIVGTPLEQMGPLLITHWGFSGPAVLKLSAWGARILHALDYRATLLVDWLPDFSQEELRQSLLKCKTEGSSRQIATECPFELSRNLWKKLTAVAGISAELRWSELSNKALNVLVEALHAGSYKIEGKSTHKEEFVTCGGVSVDQVDWKTMESRLCPRLYFAGEVLDVDGVTGGFNFQNAWTTSWLAGQAIASS